MPEIGADDFARRFSLRAPNLMWFLGSGASAAAGIPTAFDMVWEFKQQLFISQRRVSPQAVADLASPTIRAQLEAHIDSLGSLPRGGSADEYARLFETVYPAEADRRAYLEAKIAGAKPSFGHMALATLMRAQRALIAWTTNFDPLIPDACAKVYDGTGSLTSAALDAPDLAVQRINESRWPLEVKMHGDFRSRRLKNTSDELRLQDAQIRRLLIECCRRYGLVVVGYSGRDDSIMNALEETLQQPGAFPNGLFWLHRGEDPPFERVRELLSRAEAAGVAAALVRIQNFDEIMRDLIRIMPELDTTALDGFAASRSRRSGAPTPSGRLGWPVVRLNALQVDQVPTVCRRIVCQIGGTREVRKAVEQSQANVLVARIRAGVLAYGADADIRAAFKDFQIEEFDLHSIDLMRLRYDSGERGLLREALSRAIARHRGLTRTRRRSTDLFSPEDSGAESWTPLRKLVTPLSGTIDGSPGLTWREGVGIRLDWADDRLWMLIEPRIVYDGMTPENRSAATDFTRERTVKRYNSVLNDLIAFWAGHIAGGGEEMRALGISDGVDAVFTLSPDTAFSRRAGA